MSSLLEQAIIDAKALKEAALKNAENLVVEKYAREVKRTMNSILEEEVSVGVDPAGEKEEEELNAITTQVPDAFLTEDEEKVIIDLEELDAHINEALRISESNHASDAVIQGGLEGDFDLTAESGAVEEVELEEDIFAEDEGEDEGLDPAGLSLEEEGGISLEEFEAALAEGEGNLPEDPEQEAQYVGADENTIEDDVINVEDLIDSLASMEQDPSPSEMSEASMKVDASPVSDGWSDSSDSSMRHLEDMAIAMLKDDEVSELVKEMEKLQKENKILKTKAKVVVSENSKLHQVVETLREKIQEVNVSNAKLLYINQTLESVSLNERQKQSVVEAISKAGSVREAKIIYETLKSSVTGLKKERMPSSLTEAVSNKSSLLIAARRNEQKDEHQSPFFDRMQKLAGLKN